MRRIGRLEGQVLATGIGLARCPLQAQQASRWLVCLLETSRMTRESTRYVLNLWQIRQGSRNLAQPDGLSVALGLGKYR